MSKLWCCMLAMVFLVAGSVNAAPIDCAPAAPFIVTTVSASYDPNGFGGASFSCGPVTFSNWQAVDASGGNTTGLPLALVSPSYWDAALGVVGLSFNPNFGLPAVQDIHLYFTLASSVPITAIDLGVGGTSSSITERACTGGIDPGSGNCLGSTLAAGSNFSGMPDIVLPLSTPSTTIEIFKDINKGMNGELTSFTQSFTSSVPEPASLSLIGLGLFGLGFFGRKRRS
jgi:PEP-CTERM motif